jgi:endonuclease
MARSEPTPDTAGYAVKQAFEALEGKQRSATILRWINDHYPNRWNDNTLRQHLRGCSVNHPTAIKYHQHFPRFLFFVALGEFELYEPERHGIFDDRGYAEGSAPPVLDPVDELRELTEEIESQNEFAYEAHLRDFLVKNLNILESGLTLWSTGAANSVEYPIEGRRIDILAKDREGVPVVIELKLSRGHERTLGQALYYRGKIRQLLKMPRVRIIMVAREISEELRIASAEVNDVELFSYTLTMQVEKITED